MQLEATDSYRSYAGKYCLDNNKIVKNVRKDFSLIKLQRKQISGIRQARTGDCDTPLCSLRISDLKVLWKQINELTNRGPKKPSCINLSYTFTKCQ